MYLHSGPKEKYIMEVNDPNQTIMPFNHSVKWLVSCHHFVYIIFLVGDAVLIMIVPSSLTLSNTNFLKLCKTTNMNDLVTQRENVSNEIAICTS